MQHCEVKDGLQAVRHISQIDTGCAKDVVPLSKRVDVEEREKLLSTLKSRQSGGCTLGCCALANRCRASAPAPAPRADDQKGWASLPKDLMAAVLRHVSSGSDVIALSGVCSPWRRATLEAKECLIQASFSLDPLRPFSESQQRFHSIYAELMPAVFCKVATNRKTFKC